MMEKTQDPQGRHKAISSSAEATKNDPKALPDKESRQTALKAQEKKASGQ